jgi:hypothetical protein
MVFDQIEKLKQEYTDKYVVVDESRPELLRFKGMTGTVRTVNMNGRALVEFDANLNTGWFDIAIDFLNVIDKPLEKPEAPKAATTAKPATKPAAKTGAIEAKKPAAKGAMSAADILSAARGGSVTAKKTEKPAASGATSTADILAAARGGAAAAKPKPAAAKSNPAAMSASDILAAARGGAAPAKKESAHEPAAETEPVADVDPGPAPVEKPSAPTGNLPTTVADILAFCRERDGS